MSIHSMRILTIYRGYSVITATSRESDLIPRAEADASQPPSAAAIVEALVVAVHALQRFADQRIARCNFPMKLSGSRLRVLFEIEGAGTVRMGHLAAKLGIAARTVTDLVDGLEQEGLLRRQADPTDRRATLLMLTPVAQAHFAQVDELRRTISEEALAPLDAAERRQFLTLLNRLTQGSLSSAAERPWGCQDK